ncbi:MAG: response regulator [Bacteroidota bacterium]
MKFLITDDLFTNRLRIGIVLKSMGIDYDQAQNGEEAIEKISNIAYDLVLMDIEMPVKNGLETTLYIRQKIDTPSSKTKIVAITAHDPQDFEENFANYGFDGFISKPITKEKLEIYL